MKPASHARIIACDAARGDGRPAAATAVVSVLDNDVPEDATLAEVGARYNAQLAAMNREGGLKELGVRVYLLSLPEKKNNRRSAAKQFPLKI